MSSLLDAFLMLIYDNLLIAITILAIILIIMSLSLAVIFHKTGTKFWKGLIPIYNIIALLIMLEIPVWMMSLLFIPFVNFIGIPIMGIIIGNKLGRHCYQGIIKRLGLMLLPVLFFPIVAMSNLSGIAKKRIVYVDKVVEVKEFSLDPVIVAEVDDVPEAMSLSDLENIKKLEEIKKKAKAAAVANAAIKKETREEHLAKADKEKPTAKDLTFDYSIIYENQPQRKLEPLVDKTADDEKKEVIKKVEYADGAKIEGTKAVTFDYNALYGNTIKEEPKKEEKEKEDTFEVEPIVIEKNTLPDSSLKEITVVDLEEPVQVEEKTIEESQPEPDPVVEEELVEKEVVPIIHNIVLEAAEPIDNASIGVVPLNRRSDKGTKKSEDIQVATQTANEVVAAPTVQYQQMESMQIDTPTYMPVAVVVAPPPPPEPEPEPEIIIERKTFLDMPATLEPKKQEDYSDMNQSLTDPTAIFGASVNGGQMRPQAPVGSSGAQVDKPCPGCGAMLKRDANSCFMCGYGFY